jgi:DNA polymerase
MAVASARGKWGRVGDAPLLAISSPRFLIKQPQQKRQAWADLQAFAARVAAL